MAGLTATGGGALRDILVGEIPAVIRLDFYATAALIGGGIFTALGHATSNAQLQLGITAVATSGLRLAAMWRGFELPRAPKRPTHDP